MGNYEGNWSLVVGLGGRRGRRRPGHGRGAGSSMRMRAVRPQMRSHTPENMPTHLKTSLGRIWK